MGAAARRSLVYFWPWLYLLRDGDTDLGRFNPIPGGPAFTGYPAKATSPYQLPYAPGNSVFVGQGNQGLWSHHLVLGPSGPFDRVYAYDFSMDEAVEILASRPGTVVDYFDWVPDDTDPGDQGSAGRAAAGAAATASGLLVAGQTAVSGWNFITIRHDVAGPGGTVPDPVHDVGPAGAGTTTYAVYGHGRFGSVRAAFAARPTTVAANNIIGQPVLRGQPIMYAGDTGMSFHNHLHMEVRTGPAPPVPPATTTPVAQWALDQTLPFVFSDCRENDGVCGRLNFYSSTNTRVP
jgi:hypothetical protein